MKKMLPKFFLIAGLMALVSPAASAGEKVAKVSELKPVQLKGGKVKVTTTINMISDLVQNVGGNRVQVTGLMGPGVDPHLYKASARDVRSIQDAHLIFYNGLHLEGKMVDLLERSPKAVAVTDAIPRDLLITPPGGFIGIEGLQDPHVWFDVPLWKHTVHIVRDALTKVDPSGRKVYANNAASYLKKLDALHQRVDKMMSSVPKRQRVLITAHDAFSYFGRRYGVEVRGIQGISTVAEAGTKDIQDLATFIVDRKIPAVFIESSVPKRTVEAVVQATRARGTSLKIGGELFSDAAGAPGTREGTYIGMVEHNARTISDALRGK
ncbi:zinc ABC transporter substrate-binding protein [Deinococcus deserti]|uniref:Putative metal ion ABC transporter, periplasmic component/surface adhesin n=1 Tax=Deinococcus deserti (strain DSM 17065 / CIP 109153 / LMG 22923 / VCD115) TaxID=546414 RepID=C1D408_DEIDV|nr:zinc ABC transporter substrate-binding protein [Deinococcus deserti]ACO48237.1 putative metal ion ABC transporter, periplasmic component/surface adhesin [Deinococcus deserti VCD115]